MQSLQINEIQVCPINPVNGLIAFASCVINQQFFIGSIGIHTASTELGYRLVFPTRPLRNGTEVPTIYPINKETEQAITKAIVEAYVGLFPELKPFVKKRGDT